MNAIYRSRLAPTACSYHRSAQTTLSKYLPTACLKPIRRYCDKSVIFTKPYTTPLKKLKISRQAAKNAKKIKNGLRVIQILVAQT